MRGNYLTGTTVRCEVRLYDSGGAPVDPSALAFRWKSPQTISGWEGPLVYGTDPEVIRRDDGYYTVDLASAGVDPGTWTFRWDATAGGLTTVVSGSYALAAA